MRKERPGRKKGPGSGKVKGGRKEGARVREGEKKKVLGQENKEISLASFKATATPGPCDISQPIGLANLALPHLLKGCFGVLRVSPCLLPMLWDVKFLSPFAGWCALVLQTWQLHALARASSCRCSPKARSLSPGFLQPVR